MKTALITAIALSFLPALAVGQKFEMKFDSIAAKASSKSEVDLDGPALQVAAANGKQFVPKNLQGALASVKEVHVRNYEFEQPGVYSDQDLEPLRKEVAAATGWSRVVNVKEKNESTQVYIHNQDGKVAGILVIAAEPKELTVVQVLGEITMDQLSELVHSQIHYDLPKQPE
ncbi:MAG TPA: DUF4252 domain-containing protein [Bryobacteraceae bacterium]|nr:DUF4252 domain-containing protein [Bryobacteraceae bacterium]